MRWGHGRAIILAYHRVAQAGNDPHMLCVRPDRFADQVHYLSQHAEIIPLSAVRDRSSERRVVITFDDGYADNASVARPILEPMDVPASFFITSGMIGTQRQFWWDRLESILLSDHLSDDHLEVDIDGQRVWMDVRSPSARDRAHSQLHGRLRRLPVKTIERILDEIAPGYKAVDRSLAPDRAMSEQELSSLGKKKLFEVGAHTVWHPLLPVLSPEEQRVELSESRAMLEGLTGKPVTAFSYPFGGHDAFGKDTVKLVKAVGYTVACTGFPGAVSSRSHPLRLPRHFVHDWDRNEFAGHLSQWFAES